MHMHVYAVSTWASAMHASPLTCIDQRTYPDCRVCVLQVYNQSGEDGAISTVRAATDPDLTGKGFKYFGPFYQGPAVIHTGNDSRSLAPPCQ